LSLVVELTQKRKGFRDPDRQDRFDQGRQPLDLIEDFTFRGGCTLVLDLETAMPCYFIRKSILAPSRLARQREWLAGTDSASLRATYFGATGQDEPFAMIHRDT
jgi:hypothetical protein